MTCGMITVKKTCKTYLKWFYICCIHIMGTLKTELVEDYNVFQNKTVNVA